MGMDAEVLVIAPYGILRDRGLLEYHIAQYKGVLEYQHIICTLFVAVTTEQSKDLATICMTDPMTLGNHLVRHVMLPPATGIGGWAIMGDWIGDDRIEDVMCTLTDLLSLPPSCSIQIWYMPNA